MCQTVHRLPGRVSQGIQQGFPKGPINSVTVQISKYSGIKQMQRRFKVKENPQNSKGAKKTATSFKAVCQSFSHPRVERKHILDHFERGRNGLRIDWWGPRIGGTVEGEQEREEEQ